MILAIFPALANLPTFVGYIIREIQE